MAYLNKLKKMETSLLKVFNQRTEDGGNVYYTYIGKTFKPGKEVERSVFLLLVFLTALTSLPILPVAQRQN